MPPRKSRQVRGETGALFDVDAAMLDEPRAVDGPFRNSAGPPPATAIKPAPAVRDWRWVVFLTAFAFALGFGAMVGWATGELNARLEQGVGD